MGNDRDYPNSGILFRNDRPGDNPKAPTHKGSGDICCPGCDTRFQFSMSAWVKEGKKGKFFSFSFKPRDDTASRANDSDLAAAIPYGKSAGGRF